MTENFDFSHFSSFTGSDGKKRNIRELQEYLKKGRESGTSNVEREKGEYVRLKFNNYLIKILYINYEMPGIGIVDYAGYRADDHNDSNLYIFNANDIEEIVQLKEPEGEEK